MRLAQQIYSVVKGYSRDWAVPHSTPGVHPVDAATVIELVDGQRPEEVLFIDSGVGGGLGPEQLLEELLPFRRSGVGR